MSKGLYMAFIQRMIRCKWKTFLEHLEASFFIFFNRLQFQSSLILAQMTWRDRPSALCPVLYNTVHCKKWLLGTHQRTLQLY